MKTSEVLNRAADLIEERGWTTGEGWPEADPEVTALCLEGGIMAAQGMTLSNQAGLFTCPAYRAVRDYLDWQPKIGQTYLFQWNDRPNRTAAEVIEVLRACALIEQAREEQDAAWATYAGLVTA
jgi:hypothetical protein